MCGVLGMCGVTNKNDKKKGQFDLSKIDPAEFTGSELYNFLSDSFYPFVRFKNKARSVNFELSQLWHAVNDAHEHITAALNTANHYQGSNLQKDLLQDYQKLKELIDFLEKFGRFQVEDIQEDASAKQ